MLTPVDVIDRVRERLATEDAALLDLFEIYAAEALFGQELIHEDLLSVDAGATLLEVGAGPMLLALCLAVEGYSIIAVEPTATGFSHFASIRAHTLQEAERCGARIDVRVCTIEEYVHFGHPVAFAFAINAMEHVADVEAAVHRVVGALAVGHSFRIVCPNYRFPYEPHFNALTLGTRRLTDRFLSRRWIARAKFPDPEGTWNSLNWITTSTLHKAVRRTSNADLDLGRQATDEYLQRWITDGSFAQRKTGAVAWALQRLPLKGVARLLGRLPLSIVPVIDARITRTR